MHNQAKTRRGAVSLLLILAMLTVLVAAFLPVVSSAEPAEFKDFGYQTPNDYDMLDANTNLRFVFQVPASKVFGYTDVGFVFSKTDATPTLEESCPASHAKAVYSTITADGKTVDADDGGYWVAVKLINIPQSYFDGPIYVAGFVTDGEGTRYSAAAEISVWGANAIEYHSDWNSSQRGNSDYTLDGKNTFGVMEKVQKLYSGSTRYFPNADNDYAGNDLLVEFSFLYNNTMLTLGEDQSVLTVMYVEDYNLFNVNLKTGLISNRSRTGDVVLYKADGSGNIPIGGYGWHRFGVRIHQEAINNNGVEDYKIIATAYLDGEKILEVDKTTWIKTTYGSSGSRTGKLFNLFPHTNRLVYGAITKSYNCDVYVMAEELINESGDTGYLVLQDLSMSCGQTFKQQVTKVVSPASKTYISPIDGTELTGDVYFTAAAAHDHVWDSEYTMTQAPTLLANGLKAEHCTVCGEGRTVVATPSEMTPVVFNGHDATAPNGWQGGNNKTLIAPSLSFKALADDNGHFYPTNSNPEGNDLLVEFSILWNDTLCGSNSAKDLNPGLFNGASTHKIGNTTINGSQSVAFLYLSNGDCSRGTIELNDGGTGASVTYLRNSPNYSSIGANGWHRIGIRYHQTAAIVNDAVAYTLTYTIYVDGVRVSEVLTSNVRFADQNYLLYTATIDNGQLKYADGASDRYYSWIQAQSFFGKDTDCYLALADYSINAGHDFVQQVEPAVSPVAAPFDLGSYDPAVMHYQPVTP